MNQHSIQRRLLLWLLGVLLLAALITAAVVYHEARQEANVLFDYQLRQVAQSLPGQLFGPLTGQRSGVPDNADGVVIQIYNLRGERLYQSHPDAQLPQRIVLGFTTAASPQGDWRVYSALFVDDVIEVAQPMRVRRELAEAVALRTVAPLIALVPLFGVLIWITVGRGLASLRSLANAVSRRSAAALDALPESGQPAEVQPLVREINLLLHRVNAALASQREFIADAAHAMRTPVTAVDLQLQLAERAANVEEMRAALVPLRAGVSRSQRLIEQLLTLARNEPAAQALVREAFDLHALLQEVLAELAPLAIRRQIELGLMSDVAMVVHGHREGLRVAAANLVDNAVRYTQTGGHVAVFLQEHADAVTLVVEDDGPGIAPAERQRVLDRFYRGASASETGSGLGLSIVERIVAHHGGLLELSTASAGHGLRVVVRLPRAPFAA